VVSVSPGEDDGVVIIKGLMIWSKGGSICGDAVVEVSTETGCIGWGVPGNSAGFDSFVVVDVKGWRF